MYSEVKKEDWPTLRKNLEEISNEKSAGRLSQKGKSEMEVLGRRVCFYWKELCSDSRNRVANGGKTVMVKSSYSEKHQESAQRFIQGLLGRNLKHVDYQVLDDSQPELHFSRHCQRSGAQQTISLQFRYRNLKLCTSS